MKSSVDFNSLSGKQFGLSREMPEEHLLTKWLGRVLSTKEHQSESPRGRFGSSSGLSSKSSGRPVGKRDSLLRNMKISLLNFIYLGLNE